MSEIEATGDLLLFAGQTETVASVAPVTNISPDASLVESVRLGDRDAFGKLYNRYSPMVHGILLARVPRSEVDDLVQDIFLVALKRLHTLRDANAFGAWLAMITRNRAMDFYRQTRETEELPEDIVGRSFLDAEAREVLAVIRQLPEAYRETLVLRLVEGMTGPEIAQRTGLKPESVRVNLHRGMKILRERLGITETL
ncbi:MAG TPA: sigma-70 family RNA polymerase sigma factor [Pyrinomonadaceae bacterium]|jgi:RNA polymerase sigma-70 factor (ECF subfamily)